MEQTHRQTKKPRRMKWWQKSLLTLVTIICAVLAGLAGFVSIKLQTLPHIDAQYLKVPTVSQITDKDGTVIWKPTNKRVESMTFEEIPEIYKQGLVAVEDRTFWTSNGFSWKGVLNMIVSTVRSKIDKNYEARGGSTLEQQLIKNVYFNGGQGIDTVTRKIQELFLARQITENFSKEELFTYYVNRLEYAEGDTGLKAIMKTYFNKTPEQYTERTPENISELAYLVGLGQAPSGYNLYEHPEAATKRRNIVLGVMLKDDIITQQEYDDAIKTDLTANLQERYWEQEAQRAQNQKYKVYTDLVLQEVSKLGYDMERVSLNIKSHLDSKLFDEITNRVRQDSYYQDGDQQVAVTVIDKDGIVKGIVGSRHGNDEYNRAMQQTRSSGSSTKPFTAYAPLFEYFGSQYNSGSMISSANYRYPGTNSIMYNFARATYGNVTLQQALRLSLNTPVGRIDDEILGSSRMKQFLNNVGLDVKDTYSSVDGIGLNISTVQAAAAYNTLNNDGTYIEPRFVDTITFPDGTVKTVEPVRKHGMNASTAYVIAQMLRGVVQPGSTGQYAHISGYQGYAGKTGSVAFADDVNPPAPYGVGASDNWFNSVTNGGYSIAIWTGYDEPNTSPQLSDNYKGYLTLGKDLQYYLTGGQSPADWTRPDTVRQVGGSGLNATYAVTDSQDVGSTETTVSKPQLAPIKNLRPVSIVEKDWQSKIPEEWKPIYQLWQNTPDIVENNTVLTKQQYDILKSIIGGNN